MQCLDILRSGSNKAQERVWLGFKDEPVLGPCCWVDAISAPACSSKHLGRLLGHAQKGLPGQEGPQEPVDRAHGSPWSREVKLVLPDTGLLPWEAQCSGHHSQAGDGRRGLS